MKKDHEMTVAEKDCVMTNSKEVVDDLNAFVNEKLQFMTENGLEQLVGDESVVVKGILNGNVATVGVHIAGCEGVFGPGIDQGRTTSV